MLFINYKNDTPQQRFYSLGVKGNNKSNKIVFVVARHQADVDLLDFACSLKVECKEHKYLDLIRLEGDYDENSDTLVFEWLMPAKSTQYRNLEMQLEFLGGEDEIVWQTLIAEIELNETIKVGEVQDDKELSVLKQMEIKVEELDGEVEELQSRDYVYESDIEDNLESTDPEKVLSAKQGKVLNDKINTAISGTYKPRGSKTVAQLNAIDTSTLENGFVFNMLDSGVLTIGSVQVNEGDNVAWIIDNNVGSWDKLAGMVDLSNYLEKTGGDMSGAIRWVDENDVVRTKINSEGITLYGDNNVAISLNTFANNPMIVKQTANDYEHTFFYHFPDESGTLALQENIANHQATTTIVFNALTNINGWYLSAYEAELTEVYGGYTFYTITKGGNKLTEAEARAYLKDMSGSDFLPKYDYNVPANSFFIFADSSIWKVQYTSEYGLQLYRMSKGYVALTGDQTIEGDKTFQGDIFASKRVRFTQHQYTYVSANSDGDLLLRGGGGTIWAYNNLKPINTGTQDLGSASYVWKDGYFGGQVYAQNTFNVINATDIVNNTLTQAQYDLITNGKPTLIKGSLLSRDNIWLDVGRVSGTYYVAPMKSSTGYVAFLDEIFSINTSTKACSISSQKLFRLNNVAQFNEKNVPNYPSTPAIDQQLIYGNDDTLKWGNISGFKVISAPTSTILTDDEYAELTNNLGHIIQSSFLGKDWLVLYPTKLYNEYNRGLCMFMGAYGDTSLGVYIINTSTKEISIQSNVLTMRYNGGVAITSLELINNRTIEYYLNNVLPYATNTSTELKYETFNEISLSVDRTFTLKTAPTNTFAEYNAHITNSGASTINLTFTGVSSILCNDDTISINSNVLSLPSGFTIEVSIVNGKMVAVNFEA